MAMDIDPFSMLEVSLQEEPEPDDRRHGSSGIMHQVENDIQIVQPPPPFQFVGNEVITPRRAVISNIHKLAQTSKEEEKFRRRAYSSISLVLRRRLHCTICDAHIGAYLGLKDMDIEHPLLKVLACSKCTLKYHYLEFPLNLDGRDIRCRWCTESAKEESPLRYCSYCPFAFCEMCIYRNLPLDELASNKASWVCFVCNVKDLWPSRAVLWALRVLIDTNLALKEEKKWSTDQSTCCKNKAMKQRRQVSLPPTVVAPQNGHNPPPPLRPIAPAVVNNYRPAGRSFTSQRVVRPILPITPTRALPMSSQNSTTQLYDTAWLTEKVHSISTTLLNLNNNLHRIAQGIPEKENKYSIKSKMISMVSLLNISATQLQKASKEMEEESKKILDKNYKVAKVTPVSASSPVGTVPEPIKISEPKVVLKPVVVPPKNAKKRRYSSAGRNKRFKGSSEFDSEYEEDEEEDFDDPDWNVRMDGDRPRTRLRTRACFVKLERLDEKIVDDLKTESNDGFEPQPSTSKAPDPLGTVGPEELKAMGGDEEIEKNGECVDVEVKNEDESGDCAPAAESAVEGAAEVENAAESAVEGATHSAVEGAAESAVEGAADDTSQPAVDGSATKDSPRPAAVDDVAAEDSSNATVVGDSSEPAETSRVAAQELAHDSSVPAPPATASADVESSADVEEPGQAQNDDSRPAGGSHVGEDSSQPAASPSDNLEPEPPAKEDSRSSSAPDQPPSDAAPISGLSDIASAPSPELAHESVGPADDVNDDVDATGDDPLNESSATDSSITDSSTTSVDTSDS